MIDFKEKILSNGLHVIHHKHKSPVALCNVLYKVGSKDEIETQTGFAHFFEHLMFSGTKQVPDFDERINELGAGNNAFTSTDLTNYYIEIPNQNLEYALFLEADRMRGLNISEKAFLTQQKVVIEEFRQRYLNQPYGDLWLKLRPKLHNNSSYGWATIGKNIEHIEEFELTSTKSFYDKHYQVNNAILSICSNHDFEQIISWAEKYFADIKSSEYVKPKWWVDDILKKNQRIDNNAKVPMPAVFFAYQMPKKMSKEYLALDLFLSFLASYDSSPLQVALVHQNHVFNNLVAHSTGEIEGGSALIGGQLNSEEFNEEIVDLLERNIAEAIHESLTKESFTWLFDKFETEWQQVKMSGFYKGYLLAYGAYLGNTNWVNNLMNDYKTLEVDYVKQVAEKYLLSANKIELVYHGK